MIMDPADLDLDLVFRTLDARLADALDVLVEHVEQPSVSATGDGIRPAAEQLRARMEACGLAARIVETAGNPAVIGRHPGPPGAFRLVFYGHYDVQPAVAEDGWASPPFVGSLRHRRIYGRGSADNKGQHLAVIFGLAALLAQVPDLPLDVSVIIEGEEEITSPSLGSVLDAHRAEVGTDLVIATDGAMHASGAPTLVRGCRGLVYLEVTASGANRELHGGSFGGAVPNAASLLVQALGSLHGPDGAVAVQGFADDVLPPTQEDLDALAAQVEGERAALARTGPPIANEDDPLLGHRTQLNPHLGVAGLSSGFQGLGMKTVVPHRALGKVECRLVPGQSATRIGALLVAHLSAFTGVEARVIGATDPYRCTADAPRVAEVAAAIGRAWDRPPLVVPSLGGTLPLATLASGLAAPVLLVPLGGADQNNHGVDESLRIDHFRYGMRVAAAIAAACASRMAAA